MLARCWLRVWTVLGAACYGLVLYWLGRCLPHADRENCLTYVLRKWHDEGGGLIVVRSRYGWWPHFQHEDAAGVRTEYVPTDRPSVLRRISMRYVRSAPPLIFPGRVRRVR